MSEDEYVFLGQETAVFIVYFRGQRPKSHRPFRKCLPLSVENVTNLNFYRNKS